MAGSDYPFAIMDRDPALRIAGLGLDDTTLRQLRRGRLTRIG